MSMRKNWAGNHTYRYQRSVAPHSVAQLREAVLGSRKVRVVATRHSFNEICDSDDLLIDVTGLASEPTVDLERRVVTVPAGTGYATVAQAVHAAGLALPNMGSLPHISVIGACSTGTHGSGAQNKVLGSSVAQLRIMLADGSVLELDQSDPRLKGAVVGLGGLGVVLDVDLRLVPTYSIHQSVELADSWTSVRGRAEEILRSAYSVSIFTRWSDDDATELWLKRRVEVGGGWQAAGSGPSQSVLLGDLPHLTVRDEIVPWLDALPHFRMEHEPSFGDEIQTEYFVHAELTSQALAAVSHLAEQMRPHLLVSEIRAVAADDLWLSPAYMRDSTAIHFTWRNHPEAVSSLVEEIEHRLGELDARPHWGKVFSATLLRGFAAHDRVASFARLVEDLDPAGKFSNDFLEGVLCRDT